MVIGPLAAEGPPDEHGSAAISCLND